MNTTDWIFDPGQNRLVVQIGGRYELVRCRTLYQVERYKEVIEAHKAKAAAMPENATTADVLMENLEAHLDFAEIALNPEPGKMPWPRQVIREKLDPDQVQLLAEKWLERFLRPRVERDPSLPPPPQGQR